MCLFSNLSCPQLECSLFVSMKNVFNRSSGLMIKSWGERPVKRGIPGPRPENFGNNDFERHVLPSKLCISAKRCFKNEFGLKTVTAALVDEKKLVIGDAFRT